MRRRVFLIGALMTAVTSAVAACFRKTPPPEEKSPEAPRGSAMAQTAIPDRYRPVLRALVTRLYPEMAVNAKAVDYIERELQRGRMQGMRRIIMNGCVQLDRVALGQLKNGFAALAPADQDLVITAVRSGDGAPQGFHGEEFLTVAVVLTLEGVFSDPVYGGNADEAGWKSIGWEMQMPRPTTAHD